MSSPNVLLLLGAGPRVGKHVALAFTALGYKVALASRTPPQEPADPDTTHFRTDLSDPSTIPALFANVTEALGTPSVVVYNGAASTSNDPANPFSISVSEFERDLRINTTSVYAAAQSAASGFSSLPASAARTFIYTGNILNTGVIIPPLVSLGVGKSASAYLVHAAAKAYKERGYKFYYADERMEDGKPMYAGLSGEAHAKHFVDLVEGKEQGEWLQTFVKGVGYKKF